MTYDDRHSVDLYIRYLVSTIKGDPHDLRVLVDCANGAASVTAQRLFNRYDMDVNYINDKPNGVNINVDCGSTHRRQAGPAGTGRAAMTWALPLTVMRIAALR